MYEGDKSPPSSEDVNDWRYSPTATPSYAFLLGIYTSLLLPSPFFFRQNIPHNIV
jgi:hypothetical protein